MNQNSVATAANAAAATSDLEDVFSVKTSEPNTMAELLAMHPLLPNLTRGSLCKGIVFSESKAGFYVDLGRKTESFCSKEEAGDLKVGDHVTFYVLNVGEDEEAGCELSYMRVKRWQDAEAVRDSGATAHATVRSVAKAGNGNDAGLNAEFGGLMGFIPRSEIEVFGKLDAFVGKTIPVKVLIAEQSKGRRGELVLSQSRAVQQVKDEFLASLNAGDVVEGTVSRIIPEKERGERGDRRQKPEDTSKRAELGALIDLGSYLTGLVHRTECSDDRSSKPSDVVTIGETVRVEILEVDREGRKVKLSLKSVRQREFLENLNEGDTVTGVVKRLDPNIGYFVRLGGCIDGLLHKVELGTKDGAKESLALNSEVEVKVIRKTKDGGQTRIGLSRKGL